MVVYQLAMILCVVSESVGTAALSDYVNQKNGISSRTYGQARVHNSDFVGIASFNIFVGIAVATIFGSGFFFDLFWPERSESRTVRHAWKIFSIAISILALIDVLAMTVIVATHRTTMTGVTTETSRILFAQYGPPPPIYHENAKCVAAMIILWPGVIATFISTYVMHKSHKHDAEFGPLATAYRDKGGEVSSIEMGHTRNANFSREMHPTMSSGAHAEI